MPAILAHKYTYTKACVLKMIPHVYLRVSTRSQLDGGGMDEQNLRTTEYINQRSELFEIEHVDYIVDEGVSAFSGANISSGNLGKFVEAVKAGKYGKGHALVLYSLDRLSRQNAWVGSQLVSTLIEAGIEIHTVTDGEPLTKDKSIGSIISSIYFMRSNNESEVKRERALGGWRERLKKSIATGDVLTPRMPRWLYRDENGKYAIDSDMKKIIDYIFSQYINGVSTGYIARELNDKGLKYSNTEWRSSYISRLIRDERLIGKHKRTEKNADTKVREFVETIDGFYPFVVESDIFKIANNMLTMVAENIRGRTRITYRDNSILKNIFSGVLCCGICGSQTSVIKNSDGKLFVRCRAKAELHKCSSKGIQYLKIERPILEHLKNIDLGKLIEQPEISKLEMYKSELAIAEDEREKIFEMMEERKASKKRVRPTTLEAYETTLDRIDELRSEIEMFGIDNFLPTFDFDYEVVKDPSNVPVRAIIKKGIGNLLEKITFRRLDDYILLELIYFKSVIKHIMAIDNKKGGVIDIGIERTGDVITYSTGSFSIIEDESAGICTFSGLNNVETQPYFLLANYIGVLEGKQWIVDLMYEKENIECVIGGIPR